MLTITDFRIVDHGVDGSQYFQGHGLYGSHFTDCATGAGSTPAEALDDALEQLASNGWHDVSRLRDSGDGQAVIASKADVASWHECGEDDECDHYCYVSVDVRGE